MSRSIHKKRAISLILTLLLILTCVPAFGLVSSAAAGDQSVTVAAAGSAGKCAIIMTLSGASSAGDGAATYLADRALYSDLSGMGSVYSVQFGMDAMKVSAYIECEGGGISNPFSATDVIRSISDNVKHTQTETGAFTGAVPAVGETKTMTLSARMNVVYKIGDYPIFEDACSVSAAVTVIGVDTTELRRAVRAANALREECWTADSWSVLASALSDANAVLNGGNTLQNGIDEATAALDNARAALVHANGSPAECAYCLGGSAGETLAPEELLNIQYGADATRQSLDLYLPAGVSGDAPLVLFIHGGAWIFGDKDGFRSECYNGCVKYGIPYAAINYRYASIGGVDAFDIMDDIDAALAKIKEVAAARGLNIVKFMPYGVSAGSHLSLLYAYTRHDTAPITPACVFDRCGPTTLYNHTYMTQSDEHEYFEYVLSAICGQVFTKDTMAIAYEALYNASPTSYVTSGTVPTAICHGQQDNTVPFTDSEYLASLLQNNGVPYDFIIYPNSGHGLNSDPEQAAQADALYEQYVRTYLLDTMPAPAHNFTSVVTPKTCTEAGYTTYTCTDCGAYFVGDVIGAGHTEADAVEENYIAATCKDEGGYDEVVYCSVCGQELSRTHHSIALLTTHTPADAVEENYIAAT
ncbi:MAG: alpha/beta hydrolase [Clostridia bacterium]|nr:alpha/beta hydrolase [Clostridia bacterium]